MVSAARWAGRENMHLIRPGGEVEFIWSKLKTDNEARTAPSAATLSEIAKSGLKHHRTNHAMV